MDIEEITEKIIGCAFIVSKKMGHGFLENVYEKCMVIELRKAGLAVESQKAIGVTYEGEAVGEYFADLFVENQVIVELKAIRALATVHEAQLVNYLQATGIETGLLINFGETKVDIKRKFRTFSPSKLSTERNP